MTQQTELFHQVQVGNLLREIPLAGKVVCQHPPALAVGRITQLTDERKDQLTKFAHSCIRNSGGQPPAAPAPTSRMHFGKLATSARLQATLAALQNGRWHTTREIRMVTDSEAVHSDMNALRYNGIAYECEPCGGKKYRYRLVTV